MKVLNLEHRISNTVSLAYTSYPLTGIFLLAAASHTALNRSILSSIVQLMFFLQAGVTEKLVKDHSSVMFYNLSYFLPLRKTWQENFTMDVSVYNQSE